jgi:penicillin-binding protein 1C
LRTLRERGYINDDELGVALSSDLGLVDRRPRPGSALHVSLRLADDVKRARALTIAAHTPPPTTVAATLDLDVQATVHQIVVDNVNRARAAGATNGSAIVIDSSSGDVLAWVGSVDYFDTAHHGPIDYNRARRSPGSALKPFIYALALDPNRNTRDVVYTAATPLADTPMDIISDGGKSYLPQNLSRTFMGPMSVREALGNSRNIPALRVLASVGVPAALRFFEAAGVHNISWVPGHYGLGLALGNLHVSPEELARLYLVLRHHGATQPIRFSDLDTSETSTSSNTSDSSVSSQLLSPTAADLVTHILSDPAARRPSFAEGSPLDYDTAVAVKTGTSQGYRDGWTVAFSDRLLVVMWIGNHDWRRMNHIGGLAGTAEAAHRVFDAVQPQLQRHIPLPLSASEPAHSERREVCALSGLLAGPDCPHRRTEVFLKGTAPSHTCAWHQRVHIDVRNGDLATEGCPARFVAVRSVVDLPADYHRWARAQRLPLRPAHHSRLCGGLDDDDISIALTEPNDGVRYAFDPDTPPEYATIRLSAEVSGTDDDVVFLVDDTPVAQVSYPYETRWTLAPGTHRIRAVLAQHRTASNDVSIVVHR